MTITKKDILEKLHSYLNHEITHEVLVDWAENAMMEQEFDEKDFNIIRDTIAGLGVSDVKAFGLTWEDCEKMIYNLGYKVKFKFEYA